MQPTANDIWAFARYLADYVERAERLHGMLAEAERALHDAQAEVGQFRLALCDYLAWGAKTSSDIQLFERRFRSLLNMTDDAKADGEARK